MPISTIKFSQIIIDELSAGERRELSLVVAIRNVLNRTGAVKGNLPDMTKSALRKLVASGTLVESDGLYSLARRHGR
jgi:hypothetical protein